MIDGTTVAAGYAAPWVVQPGRAVSLHASLPSATCVDVVRLECANAERGADGTDYGPVERILPLAETALERHGPQIQPLEPGAQVRAACAGLPPVSASSLVFAVQRHARGLPGHVLSMLDDAGRGVVVELHTLGQTEAMLEVGTTQGGTSLQLPLSGDEWLLVVLDWLKDGDRSGGLELRVRIASTRSHVPDGSPQAWIESRLPLSETSPAAPAQLWLGTRLMQASADLRIDLVSIVPRALVETLSPAQLLACDADGLSSWERAALCEPQAACLLRAHLGKGASVQDLAQRAAIVEPQRPYTAVRGVRWDGRFQGPQQAPAHYTALHFNADTLLDAHWARTTTWQVPADLDSGCYAFRMRPEGASDAAASYATFFVSAASRPRHPLAVLLPTFTYLAYANAPEEMRGPSVSVGEHLAEKRLDALHPAHGRSIYERHADGQGVLWASTRRPLWSVSPGHRPWGWVADSWLLDWLRREGQPFDVITDHDLHRLGADALAPYRVVLTGHHPEYTSTAMWDGLWRWLHAGGRLLHLGGNGFYWRTACDEDADVIEVRRAEDGTRPSIAPPGEYHCAFSGEYGGLWRRLGRPPQLLVGVGMAAQGFERASHYRKCHDAHNPAVAFVFEGIAGETFGRAGWWGGGASGWEIDRCDAGLGTPAQTWWLAGSEGHAASMLRTKEELLSYIAPFNDAKARSDIALVPLGLGDVFAVGSMTWIGSLHGSVRTDVATITANVIRRFLDPAPLPRKPDTP